MKRQPSLFLHSVSNNKSKCWAFNQVACFFALSIEGFPRFQQIDEIIAGIFSVFSSKFFWDSSFVTKESNVKFVSIFFILSDLPIFVDQAENLGDYDFRIFFDRGRFIIYNENIKSLFFKEFCRMIVILQFFLPFGVVLFKNT